MKWVFNKATDDSAMAIFDRIRISPISPPDRKTEEDEMFSPICMSTQELYSIKNQAVDYFRQ